MPSDEGDTVSFCIYLPSRYPFKEPQVTLASPLGNPMLNLNDGRDLLADIVTEGWAVRNKLV